METRLILLQTGTGPNDDPLH